MGHLSIKQNRLWQLVDRIDQVERSTVSPKFCSLALEEEISVESYEAELKLVLKEVPIEIGNAPYQAAAEAIVIKGRMTVSF